MSNYGSLDLIPVAAAAAASPSMALPESLLEASQCTKTFPSVRAIRVVLASEVLGSCASEPSGCGAQVVIAAGSSLDAPTAARARTD